MQVKTRPYKKNATENQRYIFRYQSRSRSRTKNIKKVQKTITHIDRECVKTRLLQKYGFYCVKLSFLMLTRRFFFRPRVNQWQAFWRPLGALGAPRGPFRNFGGGPGGPKGRRMLSKGGPGGVLRAPKGAKVRNGDQQRVFKIVKITLVFMCFWRGGFARAC